MLPAGAGALFSFFARLHTGLSYTTGREKANGILDISRFFHIWTALRQGRGPSVIDRRSRWDRRRVGPARWVPARGRAGGRWGTAYPSGGRGCFGASGRSAPGAPPTRRGSPFLPRNGEKEGRGQAPWTPGFIARLLPLARFGVCATLSRSWGYFAAHLRTLIWGLSFIKCFFSIFSPENASQIGFGIPEEIAVLPYQSQPSQKPASGNERL